MVHKEYAWKDDDGLSLYGQSWMPDKQPRKIINYVHGFKDHSSRFEKWAQRLVEHEYGVIAIDLRGHGKSEGKRGYAAGFESYIKDVRTLYQNATTLFKSSEHILYGHSLGGNIVTNYLIQEQLLPSAAIVTSPWFTLAVKPSMFKMAIAQFSRILLPGVMVKSDLDVQYLSRNKSVVDQYLNDPLIHNNIRPKLFLEIEKKGISASYSIYKINIPILVMHGTDDHITSIKLTRNFVRNAGKMTTYKEWEGAYHELHNDISESEVFNYVVQWLNKLG